MKQARTIWILLSVIIAFNFVSIYARPGGDYVQLVISDVLPVISAIIAVIGMAMAFSCLKVFDETKLAWLFLLVGISCFAVAETVYGILEVAFGSEVYPNLADLFWLVGYPPLIAGIFLFMHSYLKAGFSFGNWKRTLIPAGIAFVFIILCLVNLVFLPILQDGESGSLAKFFYLFYPVGDLVLLCLTGILVYITMQLGRGRFARPWLFISLGMFCFAISDIAYSVLSWQGGYEGGGLTDVGWNLAYLLIALGGAYQSELIASMGSGGVR